MPAALILVIALSALALLPAMAAAAPGDILVVDPDAAAGPSVVRVDPVDGTRTLVSANKDPAGPPNLVSPVGIAVEEDGDLLVVDTNALSGGALIRIDPETGTRSLVSANGNPAGGPAFAFPTGLALEADGDILVISGAGVIRVDPDSGTRSAVSANGNPAGAPGFAEPFGIAVEADGGIMVTDDMAFTYATGGVIGVDPASGARTTVSANLAPAQPPAFVDPEGIAVEAAGPLVVADPAVVGAVGGALLRVNPASGRRALLSANGSPSGGASFIATVGVALEADGDIVVADAGDLAMADGQVIRVDPGNGKRTLVSGSGKPAGNPILESPVALAVVPPPPDCAAGRRDTDRDGIADACDTDDDNDRLSDRAERRLGTSSSDLDSDEDGLRDGREDRNHNGRRGRRETHPDRFDSDRDRLSDGLERGVRRRVANPPGRVAGSGRRFRRDLDPSTRTRPLRADTDEGGVPDGAEDSNRNGRVDRGEHDPRAAGR